MSGFVTALAIGHRRNNVHEILLKYASSRTQDSNWQHCEHIQQDASNPDQYDIQICKLCTGQELSHDFGGFADLESAILAHDVHEIINGRTDKLIVLRKAEFNLFPLLTCRLAHKLTEESIITVLSRTCSNFSKQWLEFNNTTYAHIDLTTQPSHLSSESCSSDGANPLDCLLSSADEILQPSVASRHHQHHQHHQHHRERAATFSGSCNSSNTSFFSQYAASATSTSMATLSWLANMEDDEFIAAKLLSQLCCPSPKKEKRSESEAFRDGVADLLISSRDPVLASSSSSSSSHAADGASAGGRVRKPSAWLEGYELPQHAEKPMRSQLHKDSHVHSHSNHRHSSASSSASSTDKEEALRGPMGQSSEVSDSGTDSPLPVTSASSSSSSSSSAATASKSHSHSHSQLLYARPRSNSLPVQLDNDHHNHHSGSGSGSGGDKPSIALDASNSVLVGRRSRADSLVSNMSEIGYIGLYSPEKRRKRIQRFIEKRKFRVWTKKVKYDVRKNFADSRVRVKGRFVRKEEEQSLRSPSPVVNNSHSNSQS